MKIDPRIPAANEAQSERVKNANVSAPKGQPEEKSAGSATVSAGDTFQLSQKHSEVQQLSAQVGQVPDVRQERVRPLRAQVQSGNYKPSSAKVADAVLAEQSQKSAKA